MADETILTVGKLREALVGIADDVPVVVANTEWSCWGEAEAAGLVLMPWNDKEECGPMCGPVGLLPRKPRFLVGQAIDIRSYSNEAAESYRGVVPPPGVEPSYKLWEEAFRDPFAKYRTDRA